MAQALFELIAVEGARLRLLRIEIDAATDVCSPTPHLGGASFRRDFAEARSCRRVA
jgi:hypothetical protein